MFFMLPYNDFAMDRQSLNFVEGTWMHEMFVDAVDSNQVTV